MSQKLKNFVNTWKVAAEKLEELKSIELSSMTEEDIRSNIKKVMEGSDVIFALLPLRASSGLIEQQMFFRKLHR
jgi:hypothetical protein